MTTTDLRFRKADAYGIALAGGDYYAFWSDGRAGLYVDGTFASYRSTTGPTIPEAPSLIHTDSEAFVADGSVVFRVDGSNLQVWDVDGDVTHDYAAPAGWVLSPAIYSSGWLWWIEREAVQHGGVGARATYFRLCQSRCDFSSQSVVQTYEAVHQFGFSVDWNSLVGLALTGAAAITQCGWWDSVAHETQDILQVRLELDGAGASDNGWPAIGSGTTVGGWSFISAPPSSAGLAVGFTDVLAWQEDDAEASPAALWPEEEAWQLSSVINSSLSADGLEGSTYGSGAGGVELVRGSSSAVGSGSPTDRFVVGPSPAEDEPDFFYIKG